MWGATYLVVAKWSIRPQNQIRKIDVRGGHSD